MTGGPLLLIAIFNTQQSGVRRNERKALGYPRRVDRRPLREDGLRRVGQGHTDAPGSCRRDHILLTHLGRVDPHEQHRRPEDHLPAARCDARRELVSRGASIVKTPTGLKFQNKCQNSNKLVSKRRRVPKERRLSEERRVSLPLRGHTSAGMRVAGRALDHAVR